MRQFFTLRYWMTLVALAALALAVSVLTSGGDPTSEADAPGPASPDLPSDNRKLDLVTWVFAVQAPNGFEMVDGRTTADVALRLDATRTMIIKAGTPGEMKCPLYQELAQCNIGVDLLGDAVLWFSMGPGAPGATVRLPAVVELLPDNWVKLANGWVVQRASVVERSCAEDTSSLTDFVKTYGDGATSTFNFEQQQIVKVTCPRTGTTTTSTTLVPIDTVTSNLIDTVPIGSTTTEEPG